MRAVVGRVKLGTAVRTRSSHEPIPVGGIHADDPHPRR
jgi:hypothetical protein